MEALAALLIEFRHGNIVALSAEKEGMERHAGSLSAHWDDRFPGFPVDYFPYASLRGVYHRNHRDAHLKDIIVQSLADRGGGTTLVNPACVFGRHACHLAARLPHITVIATDIYLKRAVHLHSEHEEAIAGQFLTSGPAPGNGGRPCHGPGVDALARNVAGEGADDHHP